MHIYIHIEDNGTEQADRPVAVLDIAFCFSDLPGGIHRIFVSLLRLCMNLQVMDDLRAPVNGKDT